VTVPRLLLINKFYHDKGPAGGVGRYVVQEEEDLADLGWDVVPFAMADADARPSPWDRHFVRARDYATVRWRGGAAGDALSLVWNREAAARLDDLIREARPTVAHLHNIYHHLSPSILPVLRRHRIPAVMTLHDLRLLCPAIHMLRGETVCERCRGGRFHQAVLGRCVKESRAASLLAAVETAHQRWRNLYPRSVSCFLCPSRFYRDKYAAWGFPADRLRHLPNFVDLDFWSPDRLPRGGPRDAVVYFGRISREKGLRTLLEAQALWERGHAEGGIPEPPPPLLLAGDGPCLGNLKARIAMLGLRTARALGPLGIEDLRGVLGRAACTVLPSRWYENAPMALLESLAAGIPVVGARIGGIPEMIEDGRTGITVAPDDPQALLDGIRRACALGPEAGRRARAWAESHADRRAHMRELAEILAVAAAAGR
jgi:glycosyltransferase involved in cell wall biosynthesis